MIEKASDSAFTPPSLTSPETDVPFTQTTNQANLHHECFPKDIRVTANDATTQRALTDRRRTVHLRQAGKGTATF